MPSVKDPKSLLSGPGGVTEDSVSESALTFPLSGPGGVGGSGGVPVITADMVITYAANPGDNPYDGADAQTNLEELSSLIPEVCQLGDDGLLTGAPNSGVPVWSFDASKVTGGFRVGTAGDFGGLALGAVAETLNVIRSVDDVVITGTVCPADRGTLGVVNIAPDGTESVVASVDLSALFVEATRVAGQVDYHVPPFDLVDRLPVLDSYPGAEYIPYSVDWTQYQLAKFTITIPAATILILKSGSLRLLHTLVAEPFATTSLHYGISVSTPAAVPAYPENALQRERYYADTGVVPVVTVATLTATATEPAIPFWLSGILGYGKGEPFTIAFSGRASQDAFNTGDTISPPDVTLAGGVNPVLLQYTGMGLADAGDGYFETTEGWSAALAPDVGDTFSDSVPLLVGSDSETVASPDAKVTVTMGSPYQTTVLDTVPGNAGVSHFLVSSSPALSSSPDSVYTERFERETLRAGQSSDLNGGSPPTFPSSAAIDTDVDNMGALQVEFGGLVWPHTDYSAGYLPANAPAGQQDYSPLAADPVGSTRFFQRYFKVKYSQKGFVTIQGASFLASGVFDAGFYSRLLAGAPTVLTAADMLSRLGRSVVLLKVPGGTGWMDLGRYRGDGTLDTDVDGAGCLLADLGSGRYQYDFGDLPYRSNMFGTGDCGVAAVRVYYFMDAVSAVLSDRMTSVVFDQIA
jgi:hypothetical protein